MEAQILTEKQIKSFIAFLHTEEKSKHTIKKYSRDIKAFYAFTGNAQITKEIVIAYKHKLISENYAVCSINSMLASINSLFSYSGWAFLKVKYIKQQRQIYRSERKELSKEEYIRLVNAAKEHGNDRLSLLIQTICATGIRVSELQFITVEAVYKGEAIVSLKGKTRSVL